MFNINNLYVIVPHRGVAVGKSRLSGVLEGSARCELNRWLLLRTLRVLGAWLGDDARRCVVVSPCASTLALARHTGAAALNERAPGLNAALAQGAEHAAARGARQLLILPCDLPQLDITSLRVMTAMAESCADVVVAPDRHGTGTNALLVPAAARQFSFGEGSLARHMAMAKDSGLRVQTCKRSALAFDLDTVQDFSDWRSSGTAIPPLLASCRIAA